MGGQALDFRSDLVACPDDGMIAAMMQSLSSQQEFEYRRDAHERELEAVATRMLEKDAALFFPTCTMANQAAIATWCRPGDSLICEESSHVVTSEAGGSAVVAAVMTRTLRGRNGQIAVDDLARALSPAGALASNPSLIVLENTHNRSAGAAIPPGYVDEVGAMARRSGAALHVDGARLFNAAVALGVEPARLVARADSVSISLNKGLGAPVGALLLGPTDFITAAERVRQRLGGGMRPIGFLAAAGVYALRHGAARLADDHRNAARAAAGLRKVDGVTVITPDPITNLVVLELPSFVRSASVLLDRLAAQGILALPFGPRSIRLAVHRDIDLAAIDRLVSAVAMELRAIRDEASGSQDIAVSK